MSEIELHTPLAAVTALPFEGRDVTLREQPAQGYVNLRGNASLDVFSTAVQSVCGIELPRITNTASAPQPPCALWLGPDEWLLRLPGEADAVTAVAGLDAELGGHFYAANDLSSAQTVLQLEGVRARALLSKGCTLDLHPEVFGVGQCAQTNVAKTVAILMPVDEADTIEVIVRRSFADYLARWLLDACG